MPPKLCETLRALREASASFQPPDGQKKWATFCKENKAAFHAAVNVGDSQNLPEAVKKAVTQPTETADLEAQETPHHRLGRVRDRSLQGGQGLRGEHCGDCRCKLQPTICRAGASNVVRDRSNSN
jgi:hypothetical protein